MLQSLSHLCCPPLGLLQDLYIPLVLRSPDWTEHSKCGCARAEWRGKVSSLTLLTMLFLMHPRIPPWHSCLGLFYPRTLHLLLLSSDSSLPISPPILKGYTALWVYQPPLTALCHQQTSWGGLCSAPSSKFLMNDLNNTGFSIEPWQTPPETGLQLDMLLVFTAGCWFCSCWNPWQSMSNEWI